MPLPKPPLLPKTLNNLAHTRTLLKDATASGNLKVLGSLLGPAYRGLVLGRGQTEDFTQMQSRHDAHFDWRYAREHGALARLYDAAKSAQWNGDTDLDWKTSVDPLNDEVPLVPEAFNPVHELAFWKAYPKQVKAQHRHHLVAWMLSQFLHGEQGALFAACQVTEAIPWMDGKLYGSTQVIDEGRHVEVFHRYLSEKLQRVNVINENLYVVVDALMTDRRWDMKFLGMQIMIEGLALGAFGTLRTLTKEPLLRQLLSYVIADEARHVHYGVLALSQAVKEMSERERQEREDWCFEVSLMLRNRFLAHEFYEEHYAHEMTLAQWDKLVSESPLMDLFRRTMFKRIIPNLKRIGLLSHRVRSRYGRLGLLEFESLPAAPDLTAKDLLEDSDAVAQFSEERQLRSGSGRP
jgi:hypothetical protein